MTATIKGEDIIQINTPPPYYQIGMGNEKKYNIKVEKLDSQYVQYKTDFL